MDVQLFQSVAGYSIESITFKLDILVFCALLVRSAELQNMSDEEQQFSVTIITFMRRVCNCDVLSSICMRILTLEHGHFKGCITYLRN